MRCADAARASPGLALAASLALTFANRELISEQALRTWLTGAGWWAPLAFVALYALATVLFLPGSVLTLAAGALFGVLPGALYSLAGATLGAELAFLVARHLAGDRVARKGGGRIKQLMEGVEAEGWRFVAFVRLVPLFPFNVVNHALGLTRVPLVSYTLASAICMLPGALAYAWLGQAGRAALAGDEAAVQNCLLALAPVAALMFLPRLLRRSKAGLMIKPDMLRSLQATGGIALVDVRDAKDFDGELGPWRAGGEVLICRTQERSRQAARLLAQQGFEGLRLVQGGMQALRKLDLPTTGLSASEVTAEARQHA